MVYFIFLDFCVWLLCYTTVDSIFRKGRDHTPLLRRARNRWPYFCYRTCRNNFCTCLLRNAVFRRADNFWCLWVVVLGPSWFSWNLHKWRLTHCGLPMQRLVASPFLRKPASASGFCMTTQFTPCSIWSRISAFVLSSRHHFRSLSRYLTTAPSFMINALKRLKWNCLSPSFIENYKIITN